MLEASETYCDNSARHFEDRIASLRSYTKATVGADPSEVTSATHCAVLCAFVYLFIPGRVLYIHFSDFMFTTAL